MRQINVVICLFLFTLQMLIATVACAGDCSNPKVFVTQQNTQKTKEHDLHSSFGTGSVSATNSNTGSSKDLSVSRHDFHGSGQGGSNEVDSEDYESLNPSPALRKPPPKLIPTH